MHCTLDTRFAGHKSHFSHWSRWNQSLKSRLLNERISKDYDRDANLSQSWMIINLKEIDQCRLIISDLDEY